MPVVLLTRPPQASARTLRMIETRAGAPVDHLIAPLLRLDPVAATPPPAEPVLTSEMGALRAAELGYEGRAWCVGPHTASIAQQHGMDPVTAQGDAESLLALLLRHRPQGPLVHLHGTHTRGQLAQRLTEAGVPCAAVRVYDQQALALSDAALALLRGDRQVIIPLFSPRSAALFWAQIGPEPPGATLRPIAMSAAVAENCPLPAQIAAHPSLEAMIDAVAMTL